MHRRNNDIDRRCRSISEGISGTGPVVYWMSRDQRVDDNWALLWAQQEALVYKRSLVVVFCLIPDYPGSSLRHYSFMLKPMNELQQRLGRLNVGFSLLEGDPVDRLPKYVKEINAHAVVGDFDPLRIKQLWRRQLASKLSVPFYEVDTHNVIPVWTTSEKKEYAAYTIRPKIRRLIGDYLTDIPQVVRHPVSCPIQSTPVVYDHLISTVADRKTEPVTWLVPGEEAAMTVAVDFMDKKLIQYDGQRNNPCIQAQSGLSPYLHFGQLSPQRTAWMASRADAPAEARDSFIEELVVRRELADNYCYYEPSYDSFSGFPQWAQITLNAHRQDKRAYCYSLVELESGATHERLWNSCQQDLVVSGKLHGYLRMYWAKKILEWSREPEEALEYAITLNDRYSLDGRDPNGYAGIAWSIGGVHDRAWSEREVFGKVRFMNERGCRRKFDVDGYINSINS